MSSFKALLIAGVAGTVHFSMRSFVAKRMAKRMETDTLAGSIKGAFLRNTRPLRSLFQPTPAGWSSRTHRRLSAVEADASEFVQTMNDRFTNPSGIIEESPQAEMLKVVETHDQSEKVAAERKADSVN